MIWEFERSKKSKLDTFSDIKILGYYLIINGYVLLVFGTKWIYIFSWNLVFYVFRNTGSMISPKMNLLKKDVSRIEIDSSNNQLIIHKLDITERRKSISFEKLRWACKKVFATKDNEEIWILFFSDKNGFHYGALDSSNKNWGHDKTKISQISRELFQLKVKNQLHQINEVMVAGVFEKTGSYEKVPFF